MHLEGRVEEIESMIFPHPTISEAVLESAAAWIVEMASITINTDN